MKKKIQIQPLQLSRETIRRLDPPKLAGVAGGQDTVPHTYSQLVACVEA
jgi:hypothetical protein